MGLFSALEPRCYIFSFFEDVVIMNDDEGEPRGEYGYWSSHHDWVEDFYIFDVGHELATSRPLFVVLMYWWRPT